MGMIKIEIVGSFKPNDYQGFSAVKHGHAEAVARAIAWLSNDILPRAIENDHRCQQDGIYPEEGFGLPGVKKREIKIQLEETI